MLVSTVSWQFLATRLFVGRGEWGTAAHLAALAAADPRADTATCRASSPATDQSVVSIRGMVSSDTCQNRPPRPVALRAILAGFESERATILQKCYGSGPPRQKIRQNMIQNIAKQREEGHGLE